MENLIASVRAHTTLNNEFQELEDLDIPNTERYFHSHHELQNLAHAVLQLNCLAQIRTRIETDRLQKIFTMTL